MEEFVFHCDSFLLGFTCSIVFLVLIFITYAFVDDIFKYYRKHNIENLKSQIESINNRIESKDSMIKMLEHYRLDYLDLKVKYDLLVKEYGVKKNEKRI